MISLVLYEKSFLDRLLGIFYSSVHGSARNDYSKPQLDAWAPEDPDRHVWEEKLSKELVVVGVDENGGIAGFGSLDEGKGYVDLLFVDPDFQRIGIGSMILSHLESKASKRTYAFSSKNALPFFLKAGYVVVRENHVVRNGLTITNYLVEKNQ